MPIGYPFDVAVLNKRVDVVLDAGARTEANRGGDFFAGGGIPVVLHIPDEELQNP
jgi:hypothetical protein